MTEKSGVGQLGACPDCGTELTRTRGRRSGKSFLWCWKCERAMRPAERRKATEVAVAAPDLAQESHWLEVHVRPEQFDRARDALMYWEVGNDRSKAIINTADIAPDDVKMALSDDPRGPLDCWRIVEIEEV